MSLPAEKTNIGFFSPFYYQGMDDVVGDYILDADKQTAKKREPRGCRAASWKKSVSCSALVCVPVFSQVCGKLLISWGKDIYRDNKPAGIGMILRGVLHITNIGSVVLLFTDIIASAAVAVARKVKGVFSNIVAKPRVAAEKVEVYSGAR